MRFGPKLSSVMRLGGLGGVTIADFVGVAINALWTTRHPAAVFSRCCMPNGPHQMLLAEPCAVDDALQPKWRQLVALVALVAKPCRAKNSVHFSICACYPCAGAMLIFSVSFQF